MTYFGFRDTNVYAAVLLVYQLWHAGVEGIVGPVAAPGEVVVIVVEDTKNRNKLPTSQQNVILATAKGSVRDWCATHCEPNGFQLIGSNDDFGKEPPRIQEALKQPRTSTPWLYVLHPSASFSGPLPETTADTLAVLQRYGGK